jgi:hypothetical protein
MKSQIFAAGALSASVLAAGVNAAVANTNPLPPPPPPVFPTLPVPAPPPFMLPAPDPVPAPFVPPPLAAPPPLVLPPVASPPGAGDTLGGNISVPIQIPINICGNEISCALPCIQAPGPCINAPTIDLPDD